MRRSAEDENCTLMFPGSTTCHADNRTTVLCHLRQFQGGGMGMKPDDFECVYGCFECHNILDGRTPRTFDDATFWQCIAWAIIRTQRRLYAKGLIQFTTNETRRKPVTKILPRTA